MLLFTEKLEELYAFLYNPKQQEEGRASGWSQINMAMDYKRMGLPNEFWEVTDLNKNYEVSQTWCQSLFLLVRCVLFTSTIMCYLTVY